MKSNSCLSAPPQPSACCREGKTWLTRIPNTEPLLKTDRYERGSYFVFDTSQWECIRKDNFTLHYDALERQPNLPRSGLQPGGEKCYWLLLPSLHEVLAPPAGCSNLHSCWRQPDEPDCVSAVERIASWSLAHAVCMLAALLTKLGVCHIAWHKQTPQVDCSRRSASSFQFQSLGSTML